jgi:hypothetical protein
VLGEPYSGTYYQQVTVKASTPDCKFSYTFRMTPENPVVHFLTFDFVVWPIRDLPVEG